MYFSFQWSVESQKDGVAISFRTRKELTLYKICGVNALLVLNLLNKMLMPVIFCHEYMYQNQTITCNSLMGT